MTSKEIRESFLDFFRERDHEIVPSASLMPAAPNLLFTNAGMNQFVPYFLGEREAPYSRAADTQKCIRAGGKHNDLEDVGFDTYHHTFFEMLGNWSFGDYFKKEALEWSWELLTEVWKLPAERLYATVYAPAEGDPSEFDQEAFEIWTAIFKRSGLDPEVHLKHSRDCFWAMGDTGPCGPCSEIHMDLTELGDTKGRLVDGDSAYCMELWNNVFIQFNALPGGTYEPLKSKYVDTGMGFERIAGIFATTRNLTEFGEVPSNYNADVFGEIFEALTDLSGHRYGRTLPRDRDHPTPEEMKDVAFRVLADHIRTLSCAIADGILPGNEGRNYVLRRILRRAVMFGRRLDLNPGFFTSLVDPVMASLGDVFPELRRQDAVIRKVIGAEEAAFDRTIDRGMQLINKWTEGKSGGTIPGEDAFALYDTYGFPLDLTQLVARERRMSVDTDGFAREMEKQRARARSARKSTAVTVAGSGTEAGATRFVGYERENLEAYPTVVSDLVEVDGTHFLVVPETPFYGEKGGQVGDSGFADITGSRIAITDTVVDSSGRHLHRIPEERDVELLRAAAAREASILLTVDRERRSGIERHHSATHILHWALRAILGEHVHQAGSLVAPDRLRFDFSHFEQIPQERLHEIERLANRRILENSKVRWYETPYDEKPEQCLAFFGEKYGDIVRVVDIGGWSVELCGGTHVRSTGEIGLVRVVSESAIAAGVRRVEAITGDRALEVSLEQDAQIASVCALLSCRPSELESRVSALISQRNELDAELRRIRQRQSQATAGRLAEEAQDRGGVRFLARVVEAENPNALRQTGARLAGEIGPSVVVLGASLNGKATVVAFCSPEAVEAGYEAGAIVRDLAAKLDGKGGGKPDFAMGGGRNTEDLAEVLAAWQKRVLVDR